MLRSVFAWFIAAFASSALGAALTVALAVANGLHDWPFVGQLLFWLTVIGTGVAFLVGGPLAALALFVGKRFQPPRPAVDMVVGAIGAFAILMGLRFLVFTRMDAPLSLPGAGAVLLVPLMAGALAGFVYWRMAPRAVPR
jgi:hypothetical protein